MKNPAGALLELVHKLDALGGEPSLVQLARLLESARLTIADVAAYVQTSRQNYHRATVVQRDHYELLVMTWLPGQSSGPHDHTGSICAVQVLQGEAVENCYCIAADGYADLQYETAIPCGSVTAGHDAGVHSLRNPSASEVLTTVHVYAPRLRDFRRFEPRPRTATPETFTGICQAPTIVVVGGGFSGSMTAAQLLRKSAAAGCPLRVVLVERRGAMGEGLAYGTRESCHVLNVPAGRMSAWADRPDDFLQWAIGRDSQTKGSDFLPRQWYGEYVRDSLLATARETNESQLIVAFDEVRRVARHPAGGWMIHVARGMSLRADAVVLAIGHRPPSDPFGNRWTGPRVRFIADPWRPYAMNVVNPDQPVAIMGTGLTAVDAALSLAQYPRAAPTTLISRRGLLPLAHAVSPVPPADLGGLVAELIEESEGVRIRELSRRLRSLVREVTVKGADWRSVVDGLRPHTARLWRAMLAGERRRFLAQLRPFWEIHRHRMAPAIVDRFQALRKQGSIRVLAGRVESAAATPETVRLTIRERGALRTQTIQAAWVLNCTGPTPSNSVESNPVMGALLVDGCLKTDELLLGVETSAEGQAIDAQGRAQPDLLVVGTLRKPALWETTAVPELRSQAAAVADCILNYVVQSSPSSK